MGTWGDILNELNKILSSGQLKPGDPHPIDAIRRKYLGRVCELTKRNAILYATRWTLPPAADPDLLSITTEDLQGFMEVTQDLTGENLDIILHSPGGSAEATEGLVKFLRTKFSNIRIIVPHAAMSAATMFCCAANRILMASHSFLGPIDPQFVMQTDLGRSAVAAHAILAQFDLAKKECTDATLLPAWLPMLRQYGPALLVQCQLAQALSQQLVAEWLEAYMLVGYRDAKERASKTATLLADHAKFKSHGRFIDRTEGRGLGLEIDDLETNAKLYAAVLGVYHATTHTFNSSIAVKMIENQNGKAFIKQQQIVQLQAIAMAQPQPPVKPPGT